MKILFLDIDGVLLSARTALATGSIPWTCNPDDIPYFDHIAIGMLRRLCKDTKCKIVLSSTWRHSVSFETIAKAHDLPIIDKTPWKMSSSRGEEIAMWLREHKEVTKYAIIDDDSDMLAEQLPNFVKTDSMEGMFYSHFLKLKEILL